MVLLVPMFSVGSAHKDHVFYHENKSAVELLAAAKLEVIPDMKNTQNVEISSALCIFLEFGRQRPFPFFKMYFGHSWILNPWM